MLQRIVILLLSVRTFSVAYYGADLLRSLMYSVGVSLLAYRTQDIGRATRPMVTEFQVMIRFSMSEASRYLTPTVREATCDLPEAVTGGKDPD